MFDALVFELGWEVCNKVGGIYTVLSTKASEMKKQIANFFMIGPFIEKNAYVEFEEEKPSEEFGEVFAFLEQKFGFKCYSGHWLVPGRPKVILIDYKPFLSKSNEIKKELWDLYRIDSWGSGNDYNEPITWAKAAGLLIEKLSENVFSEELKAGKIIIHSHEWLSSAALLHLRHYKPEIKTVFTTHATMLGRTIAGSNEPLHEEINSGVAKGITVDDGRAYKYGVQAKHFTEKASAQAAHVFTTVSDVASRESLYILGRKADIITPNGLNVERFYTMEELSNLHVKYRNIIRKFVLEYFAPYYYVNVEDSLFYFLSGRYEIRNKGIDLYIDALARLNEKLKSTDRSTLIFAFIWVPAPNRGKNIELLKHMALYEKLEDEIEEEIRRIKNRLYYSISKGEPPSAAKLLDEEFLFKVKKLLFELRRNENSLPPVNVLDVPNDDLILKMLHEKGLINKPEDKVKVIYYPTYLSSADGLLGLEYYNAVIGCHLGIFPSYYESWGYTPLETIALGLPAITTDLSGFGQFILKNVPQELSKDAVMVLRRSGVSYDESLNELTDFMYKIYMMPKKDRIDAKIRAKQISYMFSWSNLIKNYLNAYSLALQR